MLPKHQRLIKYRIEHVLDKGRKKVNYFFILKYLPTKHHTSRFCVMTSLKVSPKAVVRNRIRRQIYEIFRLNPKLPAVPFDLVLIARSSITKLSFAELTKALLTTLQTLQ